LCEKFAQNPEEGGQVKYEPLPLSPFLLWIPMIAIGQTANVIMPSNDDRRQAATTRLIHSASEKRSLLPSLRTVHRIAVPSRKQNGHISISPKLFLACLAKDDCLAVQLNSLSQLKKPCLCEVGSAEQLTQVEPLPLLQAVV
jgi:hypothetical protein